MRTEASQAGYYTSPWGNQKHPRLQVLTVRELLEGKGIDYPRGANVTFTAAPIRRDEAVPLLLPLECESGPSPQIPTS